MTSVAEALEVLEGAATTRRARTALSALQDAIGSGESRDTDESSDGKPSFPSAKSVAEMFGDEESAKGGNSPDDGAKGLATARKGS